MDSKEQLLTLGDAANRLGVSVVTLRTWVREGRLPAYRVGRRFVRLRWDELLETLRSHASEARSVREEPRT